RARRGDRRRGGDAGRGVGRAGGLTRGGSGRRGREIRLGNGDQVVLGGRYAVADQVQRLSQRSNMVHTGATERAETRQNGHWISSPRVSGERQTQAGGPIP